MTPPSVLNVSRIRTTYATTVETAVGSFPVRNGSFSFKGTANGKGQKENRMTYFLHDECLIQPFPAEYSVLCTNLHNMLHTSTGKKMVTSTWKALGAALAAGYVGWPHFDTGGKWELATRKKLFFTPRPEWGAPFFHRRILASVYSSGHDVSPLRESNNISPLSATGEKKTRDDMATTYTY